MYAVGHDDAATSASAIPIADSPAAAAASGAAVTFSPSSVTFATQNVGTTSASQTVTATNTSGASFLVNSAAVHSLDFTVVDDQCSGLTIANGAELRGLHHVLADDDRNADGQLRLHS